MNHRLVEVAALVQARHHRSDVDAIGARHELRVTTLLVGGCQHHGHVDDQVGVPDSGANLARRQRVHLHLLVIVLGDGEVGDQHLVTALTQGRYQEFPDVAVAANDRQLHVCSLRSMPDVNAASHANRWLTRLNPHRDQISDESLVARGDR